MTLSDELYALALEASGLSRQLFDAEVSNPNWAMSGPTWGSFVPCGLRDTWLSLSLDTKLAVYLTALSAFNRYDSL